MNIKKNTLRQLTMYLTKFHFSVITKTYDPFNSGRVDVEMLLHNITKEQKGVFKDGVPSLQCYVNLLK